MDEAEEKLMQDLILKGAIEFAGIDSETGEMLYTFSNKIKDVMPELYEIHLSTINKDIMYFWEKGFVNMDLFSDNPVIALTDKAFNDTEIEKLDVDKKRSLKEIKRIVIA
jgi:hypothetical protein